MFDILSPFVRGAALIALLIVGTVITQPGFSENFGNAAGNHIGLIVFIIFVWLAWRPIFWAIKLFLEGFFLGEGAKYSGVFRDRYPRRRRRWF